METMFWVWLAIIVVAVIVEIATLDLVSVWFAIGAIIPFILAAIGGIAIEIQVVVFVVVSALLIIFLRKYAQKWLFKNMNYKTNLDVQIGRVYRLLENADFEKNGSVKINDVVWTAVSENGALIEKGQLVEIVRVDGNKMIVKHAEDKTEVNVLEEESESGRNTLNNEKISKKSKNKKEEKNIEKDFNDSSKKELEINEIKNEEEVK